MTKHHTLPINRHGYLQFDKNHAGWEVNVLKAILSLQKPTAMAIAEKIGSTNATVARTIDKLRHQRFVEIVTTDNGYKIKKYGPFYSKAIIENYDKRFAGEGAT